MDRQLLGMVLVGGHVRYPYDIYGVFCLGRSQRYEIMGCHGLVHWRTVLW